MKKIFKASAVALVSTGIFASNIVPVSSVDASVTVEQNYIQIAPFNGAQFRVNPNGGVLVFHTSGQANNAASGSVHGGTVLTVVNTSTPNGRVQVRISGATGANSVWNGQIMWVNGAALDSQTTWIGGPAF